MGDANLNEYILMPLSSLAVDNAETGKCDIYIQYLDPAQHTQSGKIVIGSLLLQQYKSLWDYDLVTSTTQFKMQLSSTCTLDFAYIGS